MADLGSELTPMPSKSLLRTYLSEKLKIPPELSGPFHTEKKFLFNLIDSLPKDTQVLDYACGRGRILDMISDRMSVTGVEINKSYVELNRRNGFDCPTVDEFRKSTKKYDVIILSHITEHFYYEELYPLIDDILARLSDRGKIVIFSPVFFRDFYYTFDHIKPYTPKCFEEIFGEGDRQTQFDGLGQVRRVRMEYAFNPRYVIYFISKNLLERLVVVLVNQIFQLGYRISPWVFGVPISWMAIYEKAG